MLQQIPKQKIKLCGGLNFVVATWLLVKPQVALKLNLRWSEYFAIIGGSCHKYNILSRQTRQTCVCHDKTRLLSRQNYACRDKIMFVATKLYLSRQNYIRRDKLCLSHKTFVATNILLSRQKTCLILVAVPANDTLLGCCRTTLSSVSEVFWVMSSSAQLTESISLVLSSPSHS